MEENYPQWVVTPAEEELELDGSVVSSMPRLFNLDDKF